MALRNILTDSDPSLRRASRPVTSFNSRLHTLLDDMIETLASAGGVGLAAPQVGVLRRVVIVLEINVGEDEDERIIELINPEIIEADGEQEGPEGCLSLPGVCGIVKRPERVLMRAQDRDGNYFEVIGEGMTARAFCHEVDHLNGTLFVDLAERFLTQEELEAMYVDIDEEEDGESAQ